MIDPEMIAILACPACRAPLAAPSADRLRCANAACGLVYRVEDDIPILLVEEALAPGDEHSERPLES